MTWWRHQMEAFSALLATCAGNSPVPGEFPVTRSFDIFFDLRLNKRLSKQSWGWWLETPSCPLWRQCNVISFIWVIVSLGNALFPNRHWAITNPTLISWAENVTMISHAMASQNIGNSIVRSTDRPGLNWTKHQSSSSFVRETYRLPEMQEASYDDGRTQSDTLEVPQHCTKHPRRFWKMLDQ